MASLNKVMLIGNLGKDPDIRYTEGGTAVANFSLATAEKYKNKAGDYEEKTEWHNITAWGKLAEICGDYLAKGKQVYIEGRLETRKWTDKEGNDRYTTGINADKMVMLGGKGPSDGSTNDHGGNNGGPDDDIPF